MICYEVYINGKKICVAGVGEMGVLSGILSWVKRKRYEEDEGYDETITHIEELYVSVSGLANLGEESTHLDWLAEDLKVGDEVTFRIVERESCDPPENSRTGMAELVEKARQEYHENLRQEH